jgi:hypothetical protein
VQNLASIVIRLKRQPDSDGTFNWGDNQTRKIDTSHPTTLTTPHIRWIATGRLLRELTLPCLVMTKGVRGEK